MLSSDLLLIGTSLLRFGDFSFLDFFNWYFLYFSHDLSVAFFSPSAGKFYPKITNHYE